MTSNHDGSVSTYGPSRTIIESLSKSKDQIIEILRKGIYQREINNHGEAQWQGYNTDNAELMKIKYKLNHMSDGWGAVSFKNGSSLILEADVTIEGENIGLGKFL